MPQQELTMEGGKGRGEGGGGGRRRGVLPVAACVQILKVPAGLFKAQIDLLHQVHTCIFVCQGIL